MGVMSKPTLALASAGGVFVFLGLAILGWGGFDAFFANPARTALVIVTAALVVAALFTSGNLSSGEREDRSNRWIIGALGLIGLLSAWLPAYTDRKEFWTLDGDAVRWIGVALYAGGGALRLWPVFVLGRRFSGLVVARMNSEERLLRSQFGQEYEAYRTRTWRLVPGLY